jgi:lipid-A-disaccharide synthase
MIIAGETSGDIIGGLLATEIKLLRPNIELFGLGGDRMDTAGVRLYYHVNQLAVLGFWEIIKHLPFMKVVERNILSAVAKHKPALAILIDYPGFNLRLAGKLRALNVPVMYYVSPQVWAWGKGRIAKIKKLVNKMIVVFEFEKLMYEQEGVNAEWYGHPLLDIVKPRFEREGFLKKIGLGADTIYVGLFPGSRKQEIEKILPVMIGTLARLEQEGMPLKGIVGCAPGIDDAYYRSFAGTALPDKLTPLFSGSNTYDLMSYSVMNLVASGTATLECAMLGRPLFVLYRTSTLTYLMAKRLIKIPYIGLVNVVAGEKIAPEFIQGRCRANLMAGEVARYLKNDALLSEMQARLSKVRSALGHPGASARVAREALSMLEQYSVDPSIVNH